MYVLVWTRINVLILCLMASFSLEAQRCQENRISSQQLAAMPKEVNRCVWKGNLFHNLVDVVIAKEGSGPALAPYPRTVDAQEGVWIGQNNMLSDYSDITLTFSQPITSLSFVISAINNDVSGEEQIQQWKVRGQDQEDLTASARFTWMTGPASGMKASDKKATSFDYATKTISANEGYCCTAASGRMLIKSDKPFTQVQFRHQEMEYVFSKANGVVLMGDMKFCVVVPDLPKVPEPRSEEKKTEQVKKNPVVKKHTSAVKSKPAVEEKAEEKTVVLEHVFFEQGQYTLLESSYPALDDLVQHMKGSPSMTIALYGHTDNQGLQHLNQRLSEQRVEQVKAYLVGKGIEEKRIEYKGFGGLYPLVPNDSEAHRKQNRRVEFVVTNP